ncbi:MAG: hypothetical protein UW30_C0013G0016 [Candidatus Giovannonibacteria bacterium GW2011_GWA2_44_13b]|uniref:Uncharacterized protein n=1 Tax=Candidatus Giovannonibacteria bacterium GW2011_GWA2_44_13b TaxID=1618647 RepID=A0A0G1JAM4_9BACT|nr:MAG: hypothetical protein UW30_C0013G0016 [Candidatus Giovannonibacteria bacterium GW2011_GWA2_44_13b]
MDLSKERFEKVILRLIELGEDKEELEFWRSIFDKLSETKKEKLISNLEKEKETLEKKD